MWQKTVAPWVSSGKLVVIGVVQEQHPDRAKLYAQWRKLDWPIFVDSLNLLDLSAVPVPVALDASGVVRHESIGLDELEGGFLDVDYPRTEVGGSDIRAELVDPSALRREAETIKTALAWRDVGDALFLQGDEDGTTRAVDAYRQAVALDPKDGRAHFRLGVALRKRYESPRRQAGDAQAAVDHWTTALALNPNQYIWRRRLQQYGPRLDKPYNFYFWVQRARSEITARGERPVALSVEPAGSEIASPQKDRDDTRSTNSQSVGIEAQCAAPADKIQRDADGFVLIESVLTPSRVAPGHRLRVRTTFRLNESTRPYWNNEAQDLTLCIDAPGDLASVDGERTYPNPPSPETQEDRSIEFEMAVDAGAQPGKRKLPAYALYYVCEHKGGKCRYLRQDFTVTVTIDPDAPSLR